MDDNNCFQNKSSQLVINKAWKIILVEIWLNFQKMLVQWIDEFKTNIYSEITKNII